MNTEKISLEDAMIDPRRVFGTPENVVSNTQIGRSTKIEILCKWRQDEKALSVAENEGMEGGNASLLHRVQKAIDELTEPASGTAKPDKGD